MPSDRHENSVDRVKALLKQKGHEIWENTDEGGRGGYKLPPMVCDDDKPRSFIIDCLSRLNIGAMMAFEVELNHEMTIVKKVMLARIGIPTTPVTPGGVDSWVKDPSLLDAEIAYRLRVFRKSWSCAPKLTTA